METRAAPPDVSIILVTHRTPGDVRNCLQSLYNGGAAGLAVEVLLIDNASGDETVEMVRAAFPEVRVVGNSENAGFARANNQGIALATGRQVLLLNPDTLAPPNSLRLCVDYLDAQPADVAAMSCRVESPDGSLQWTCARRLVTPWSECCRALLLDRAFKSLDCFNREPMIRWKRQEPRAVECLLGAFMLIRRSALEKIGGLDPDFFLMYEDADWCKRALNKGFRLLFWPGARIVHLGGQSWKQDRVRTFAATHESALLYFKKHHPRALGIVRAVSRIGMALKIGLLRVNLLRRPGDAYTQEHLEMARAAGRALKTGQA